MVKLALPPITRYSSRKEWEDACWQKILKLNKVSDLLLTSYERHNLVMRAAVIDGINLKKSYTQIADELWLSPQTISSIKKALKENNYRSYRERGKKERKKKIYSSGPVLNQKRKYSGRSIPTKYGRVYLP
ncbi:MAG: hypothetical protein HYW34_03955 [Candidatus Brennerbacteria bacterium]|nr:hypothetical protein [Candidatus Brennerbacteria bacterium]